MFTSDTVSSAHQTKAQCGSKGYSLRELAGSGFRVPRWISVSPLAFSSTLTPAQESRFKQLSTTCSNLSLDAQLKLTAEFSHELQLTAEIEAAIQQALARDFSSQAFFAVRSSAVSEDSIEQSFAGQFESYLFVPPERVLERVLDVWKSAFSQRLLTYRRQKSIEGPLEIPAVLIQEMIDAEAAGVAFSADPVSGDTGVCLIEAVFGTGEGLVGGAIDPDGWSVGLDNTILKRRISRKLHAHVLNDTTGGTISVELDIEKQNTPSLSDLQILEVASLARRAADHFGIPQDIEWCLKDGQIYILQSRAITTMPGTICTHPGTISTDPGAISTTHSAYTTSSAASIVSTAVRMPEPSTNGPATPGTATQCCSVQVDAPLGSLLPAPGSPENTRTNQQIGGDLRDPAGELNIWDCSNISESYPGVTTPLTFSFARKAYEHVYREFLKLMGVNAKVVERFSHVFPCMLGLVRGRMYYNLPAWFRLLSLLPGFGNNARHMETMMGLKEPLPQSVMKRIQQDTEASKAGPMATAVAGFGLLWGLITLNSSIKRFYHRVDEALSDPVVSLQSKSALELGRAYRQLETQLLKKWDAPITNDFFAMIFYGVLRSLCAKWCGDTDGSLQNNLIAGQTGIISAEPARRITSMAQMACADTELIELLSNCYPGTRHHKHEGDRDRDGNNQHHGATTGSAGSLSKGRESARTTYEDVQERLKQNLELEKALAEYLDTFGDRCLEELKLETPTLNDDPGLLFRSIAVVASRLRHAEKEHDTQACTIVQNAAEARLQNGQKFDCQRLTAPATDATPRTQDSSTLRLSPLKRWVFSFVLEQAKERIKQRENLRFLRTRVFGRVRRIFVEVGQRLQTAGLLNDARDIFYLEVEEVLACIEGTSTCMNLAAMVLLRKPEFAQYKVEADPPVRVTTFGLPGVSTQSLNREQLFDPHGHAGLNDLKSIKGTPCSPGRVRGRIRVITDPAYAKLEPGDIIVARRTDPGWILLFPAATGLIVEHGSLLSHSAIVSRELGLPSVVGVCNATNILREGDVVQFDGTTGVIEIVEKAESVDVCFT